MLQLLINGRNIDLLNDNSVSLVLRSKMYQGSQGSRTWTLRCARTAHNAGIIGVMLNARQYVAPAAVYYGGIMLINGEARLMGWDDAAYSVVVVASASTAHIDDQRKVVDVLRAYVEAHGGWGQWTPPSGKHIGSNVEGKQGGRWVLADWWDYSQRSMAYLVEMLGDVDAQPWPTAWAAEQSKMQQYRIAPTDTMQFGGWTGAVAGGYNRMPYDVVQGKGTLKNGVYGGGGDGYYFIEFRDIKAYYEQDQFAHLTLKERSGSEGMACLMRYQGTIYFGWIVYQWDSINPTGTTTLAKFGDALSCRPYVAVGYDLTSPVRAMVVVQCDELLAVFGWSNSGRLQVGSNHLANLVALAQGYPTQVYVSDIESVSYTVRECAIEQRRGSPNGLQRDTEGYASLGYLYYTTANVYPDTQYPILGAFGNTTIGDFTRFALYVLGLDIDAQGTSEQYLSNMAQMQANSLTATFEARSDGDTQQSSAKPPVKGANGFTFTQGGQGTALQHPYKGLQDYGAAKWSPLTQGGVPIEGQYAGAYQTTQEAADAQQYKGSGVWVWYEQYKTDLGYGEMMFPSPPTPPIAFRPIRPQPTPAPTTAVTLPSRGVKYVARGRCSASEAIAMGKCGSVRLVGRAESGAVEQVTWSSSGDVEVVFWA